MVENAEEIIVNFSNGEKFKAELLGRDPKTDLAVLKVITDKKPPFVKFGDNTKARVGDWVIAIGNPFGLVGRFLLVLFQRLIETSIPAPMTAIFRPTLQSIKVIQVARFLIWMVRLLASIRRLFHPRAGQLVLAFPFLQIWRKS